MSFVFEYFGWTDELMTVGSGFDNSRDRARKYKQWVKFRGPWAPPIEMYAKGPLKFGVQFAHCCGTVEYRSAREWCAVDR